MAVDVLTCRYRLAGPLAGTTGEFGGHIFRGGYTQPERLSASAWAKRDLNLCRFWQAEREVADDGGNFPDLSSDVQPEVTPPGEGKDEAPPKGAGDAESPPRGPGRPAGRKG